MGKALPVELRVRVMAALAEGMTLREAAETFYVGEATVSVWRRRQREHGHLQPKQRTGRTRSWRIEAERDTIFGLLQDDPELPIKALRAALRERGIVFSYGAVRRFLKRHGFKRKPGRPPGRKRGPGPAGGAAPAAGVTPDAAQAR